jgi:hypothetical protein
MADFQRLRVVGVWENGIKPVKGKTLRKSSHDSFIREFRRTKKAVKWNEI